MKKVLTILILFGLLLPSFSFAQNQAITPPETLEEAKKIGEGALEKTSKELPGILENIWKKEILPIWQRMYDFWRFNIWPKIQWLFPI